MGTSARYAGLFASNWDHPHAYGDKFLQRVQCRYPDGSSPRVWGQDSDVWLCRGVPRIIPTRMGTSDFFASCNTLGKDHPHAYGDKNGSAHTLNATGGSSPRVWGQDDDGLSKRATSRIIPTRMGTSSCNVFNVDTPTDHPHAYGDKKKTLSDDSLTVGSSPRVWGQEFCGRIKVADKGIIPTRMGTRSCYQWVPVIS